MKNLPVAAVARGLAAAIGFIDRVLCDLKEDEQERGEGWWGYIQETL